MDASALLELLLQTPRAARVEPFFRSSSHDVHAPALIDVEVASALRRGLLNGDLDRPRAEQVLEDLADLPLALHEHLPLLRRALDLHENVSSYDAMYVALAEELRAPLLTADGRLAKAVRTRSEDLELVDLSVG